MRSVLILTLLLAPLKMPAALPVENATEYAIATPRDTVRFIRIGQDTARPKPVLLFLQGSLPYPLLVTDREDASVFYLDQCDFDYRTLSRDYHIVLIAKPQTPVVADAAQLTPDRLYVPDPARPDAYDPGYLRDNRPERYAERTQAVLDHIRKAPWADQQKIILLGHSEGAHVVARVARKNPDIFAVGYFSGNPLGRFAELVQAQVDAAKSGRITRYEAQERIERLYAQWRRICRDDDGATAGDARATWMGFSRPYIAELAALPMPLYVAYGTDDPGAGSCALLPVYFELAGKRNYRVRAFEGRGHNFEAIRPDGSSDYDDIQWKQALDEFFVWCEKRNN